MKIFIPANEKQKFMELSERYSYLHKELESETNEVRRTELLDEIVSISNRFGSGLMKTVGYDSSK